jgi:hypothetical protein
MRKNPRVLSEYMSKRMIAPRMNSGLTDLGIPEGHQGRQNYSCTSRWALGSQMGVEQCVKRILEILRKFNCTRRRIECVTVLYVASIWFADDNERMKTADISRYYCEAVAQTETLSDGREQPILP